jgi:hypothetical protein
LEFLERKCLGKSISHWLDSRKEKVDRRRGLDAGERRFAGQGVSLCSTLYCLLSPALFWRRCRQNRGGWPDFEPHEVIQPFVSVFAIGNWQFGRALP